MDHIPLLRNSERSDFKRCQLRWYWRYEEKLVPISFSTGPLLFGSLGHLALAEWYVPGRKRGREPQETWDEITQNLWDTVKVENYVDDEIEGTWEDARKLGHDILGHYRKHYGLDDHWEVLWVEDQFHQKIPHPIPPGGQIERNGQIIARSPSAPRAIVEYVGTIDLIVRNHETGLIEYVDHKFMKSIQTDTLYIDDQNGGYLAIGTHELRKRGTIGPKEAVRVLVYNFVRKATPPDRPTNAAGLYLNKDGTVSKRQPPPFFHRERIERTAKERNRQIQRIGEEALHIKAIRDGRLPITKTPTRDCKWDCSFFDLCNIHETMGDIAFAKKALFKEEDPYQEYKTDDPSPKRLIGYKNER
jgi:hypothetical protein